MITLYGMGSPNVVKVLIMLNEADLPYDFVRVDVVNGEQFTDAFGALNPNRKVPVLVDARDAALPVTVFESGAILMYLAETSGVLWPRDPVERYRVVEWLMLQMASLGPTAGQAIHFTRAVVERSYAQTRFLNELDRLIGVVEAQLELQPYIAGTAYSLADIAFYPWFKTLARFFPDRVPRPEIARWMDEIASRPSVIAAYGQSDDMTRRDMSSLKTADAATLDRYFGRSPKAD